MKRSKMSLSHYKLLTCDMGYLVPCGLLEVLPGDTVQQATSMLLRVSPLLAPVMHPVEVRIHHWFVPHRLVWDNWEKFITGGPDGDDASVHPYQVPGVGLTEGSIYDYYGLNPGMSPGTVTYSALPLRGYNLIWNEWYRDQDLQTELTVNKTDGNDLFAYTMQRVGWEKDYFTTARPWPSKGPEILVPLGETAPVRGIGKINNVYTGSASPVYESGGTAPTAYGANDNSPINPAFANNQFLVQEDPNNPGYPGIYADLSAGVGANINDLREAFALQRYQENRARYGSRYTEYLAFLGVRSSDARLQRPEYLGGGKQIIQFSEVLQTTPTTDGDDEVGVGNMKGHGISALRSNRYRRFFEEHGYIHSFLSVKPKTMYTQGLNRTWSRRIKEDYFQKELQHIGQQEVYTKEVFVEDNPNNLFGYQDRYDEYRRQESSIAGEFRSTLDYWHYARKFSSEPVLNASFVAANPTKRVNAVQTNHVLWVMANHSIQARRMVNRSGGRSFVF